jgi:hypothetical protein
MGIRFSFRHGFNAAFVDVVNKGTKFQGIFKLLQEFFA